ncbi:hypothetical protein N7466_006374 [Penicillium verhagenii]|uniref:uncharacterized protein n=1 Tax=Penicillium verhagenii TaxID=1562060 RepID=UPI0025453868|nr:uncharacterized protein N7466_006374 [Penicillium verhagenii]KAJ5930881.1 hypothetical protein N7466_006374 [Penicillium verhagenii]
MTSTQCELYMYTPSLALAVVAVIVFAVLTTAHLLYMIRAKAWTGIFFVLGGLAQMSGYTARLFSSQDPCNRVAYGFQSVLLLLGPSLIMFSVNLTMTDFTRTLSATRFCWVPIDLQQPLYLTINTVLIIIQTVGGIMTVASQSLESIEVASKMSIAIFVIQLVFWLFTLAENIYMSICLRRHPTEASKTAFPRWKNWNQLFGLAISIIAVGRNIVRLTMDGGIAFLVENEWPSYAFDGYQMVVVLGAWAIWYLPGKCRDTTEMGLEGFQRQQEPKETFERFEGDKDPEKT